MSDLTPFDLHRMFLGDVPLWFAAEIAARTAIMYLYALAAVRVVSRRAIGQLSLVEFLLIIALGSAVGDPMFYPDVPLLHGMVVVTVVVLLNRGITELLNRSEAAERLVEGRPLTLVTDGRMVPDEMDEAELNREMLFSLLRIQGVRHLGEVAGVWMEQKGVLSLDCLDPADHRPGLRTMPPWDVETPDRVSVGDRARADGALGCERCGEVRWVQAGDTLPACPACGGESWADAVRTPDD